jgi:hypothetical protein
MLPEVQMCIREKQATEEQLDQVIGFAHDFICGLNVRLGTGFNNDIDLLEAFTLFDPRPQFKAKNKVPL